MSETPWVACGARRIAIARADAFEPPAPLTALADVGAAVEYALAQPLGATRLRERARGAASVVVTIPDASRPCPNAAVLEPVLEELKKAGVPEAGVSVAIGCGLHATTSAAERERLVGRAVSQRLEVFDAQGIESETTDLGTTAGGTPAHIVRRVAEADLVVTIGVVEPHLYAGFSGGVKGVAIGCAGRETIAWTHHPSFISKDGVLLGRLDDNPFQDALREMAALTPLGWAVNAVTGDAGAAVAVAAGDPVAAQKHLVDRHADGWIRPVVGAFDAVIAGVPRPKSDNLYQASRAATYVGLAARPALTAGGLLVLCADLPDGAGTGPGERNFLEVLAGSTSPDDLVARGLREPLGPGGQRSFVVARVLSRHRIAVVGAAAPSFLDRLAHLGLTACDSVDAALAAEDARLGRRARVLAIADAMATVVHAIPEVCRRQYSP